MCEHTEADIACDLVLQEFPEQVAVYRNGGTALGFLIGQVMKKTQGRANPPYTERRLKELLADSSPVR